jgi:hypothetical protein
MFEVFCETVRRGRVAVQTEGDSLFAYFLVIVSDSAADVLPL